MYKVDFKKIVLPLLFLFFFILYLLIIAFVRYQDMWDHACFSRQILTGERPTPGNFLFYWLVNIFSFFSTKIIPSKISLCFLLAFATTFRYYLSQKKIAKVLIRETSGKDNYWLSVIAALSLIFVFVIPVPSYILNGYFYIGNFVPNVWHNSTIIFLFPFALLLFELSNMQLIAFDEKRNGWIILLIFLNVFIKPSYFFVYVFVYPLLLLIKYKLNKEFWKSIFPVIIGLIFLIFEYWTIYKGSKLGNNESSSVIFHPFYSNVLISDIWQLPLSLFFSLFFPFLYVIFNVPKIKKSLLFWFTTLSFLTSIFIYLFIAESGPRASHGNFYWQIVICTWFCFFTAFISLIKDFNIEGKTLKNKFLMSIYFIHVLIGIVYFVRLFVVDNYL
ncbi:MAG TPA: hypothetical protein VIK86_08515 [Candidatus Paceibacterota bacterium]